ncbi:hypothetical protein Raf01_96790 [Rugosimonospora africana]|uniref:Barstar (Barnase inhibitor) n=2 Tax=Rugosimonospora africana TaxID=556532 RepID=A0A8J3VW90_9ACTN|nr:hypothetical protein Raf01_96790 [Rugosimonospora africana]
MSGRAVRCEPHGPRPWLTVKDMYWGFARVFRFEHDHADLQGLGECLAESLYGQYGIFDDANGVALVMTGYDQFAHDFPDIAHALLNVIADRSRGALPKCGPVLRPSGWG